MTTWGISALGHDAAISVVDQSGEILFGGHAERYSKIKNDGLLNQDLISEALAHGTPTSIAWYERPIIKKTRQLFAGQFSEALSDPLPKTYLQQFEDLRQVPLTYVDHHLSHAASGYFTSPFDDAAVFVADAIGEWDTLTIWEASGTSLKRRYAQRYPHSLGLFYSAVTDRCGLKPNEEEYILMGMAAYGTPIYEAELRSTFIRQSAPAMVKLRMNLHRGMRWWREEEQGEQFMFDLAASAQKIVEDSILDLIRWTRNQTKSKNLVLAGGIALNCVVNEKIAKSRLFDNIWIMPNPGDAGSSLGAVCAVRNDRVNWETPYLGHNI
jgi:carbamoyltransferase